MACRWVPPSSSSSARRRRCWRLPFCVRVLLRRCASRRPGAGCAASAGTASSAGLRSGSKRASAAPRRAGDAGSCAGSAQPRGCRGRFVGIWRARGAGRPCVRRPCCSGGCVSGANGQDSCEPPSLCDDFSGGFADRCWCLGGTARQCVQSVSSGVGVGMSAGTRHGSTSLHAFALPALAGSLCTVGGSGRLSASASSSRDQRCQLGLLRHAARRGGRRADR
mmetsp:Transcript_35407/g.101098  ORF Transcript_35407/g.101098 Transcript_35407/m.101098 type:complete len:222 (-) Transcript_35407:321-986(-)